MVDAGKRFTVDLAVLRGRCQRRNKRGSCSSAARPTRDDFRRKTCDCDLPKYTVEARLFPPAAAVFSPFLWQSY